MACFEGLSVDKLQEMQISFVSIALGGPEPHLAISRADAHWGRGINLDQLTRLTASWLGTLAKIFVDENAAQSVYERINTYSNEIFWESNASG